MISVLYKYICCILFLSDCVRSRGAIPPCVATKFQRLYDLSSQNQMLALLREQGLAAESFLLLNTMHNKAFLDPENLRMHLQGWQTIILLSFSSLPSPKKNKQPFFCRRSSSENNMKIENSNFYVITSQSISVVPRHLPAFLTCTGIWTTSKGRKVLSYSYKGSDHVLDETRDVSSKVWVERNFWK